MIDNPESNNEQPSQTLNEVRLRCHRLIDLIAKRPGSIKLLLLAERSLTTFEQYKANRRK
jgi:hypothetical protein